MISGTHNTLREAETYIKPQIPHLPVATQQDNKYDMPGFPVTSTIYVHGKLTPPKTVEGSPVSFPTLQSFYTLKLPLDPVYVEEVDGSEVLRYREADMVIGKLYKFKWNNEWHAALRSNKGVELLEFYPDEQWPRSRPASAQFQEGSRRPCLS